MIWHSRTDRDQVAHGRLYHVAILYPSRRALADALRRLIDAGIPLDGASDHGVSETLIPLAPSTLRRIAASRISRVTRILAGLPRTVRNQHRSSVVFHLPA